MRWCGCAGRPGSRFAGSGRLGCRPSPRRCSSISPASPSSLKYARVCSSAGRPISSHASSPISATVRVAVRPVLQHRRVVARVGPQRLVQRPQPGHQLGMVGLQAHAHVDRPGHGAARHEVGRLRRHAAGRPHPAGAAARMDQPSERLSSPTATRSRPAACTRSRHMPRGWPRRVEPDQLRQRRGHALGAEAVQLLVAVPGALARSALRPRPRAPPPRPRTRPRLPSS